MSTICYDFIKEATIRNFERKETTKIFTIIRRIREFERKKTIREFVDLTCSRS